MPRSIAQYRVFIGSPGGLEEERRTFRDRLEGCSRSYAKQHDVHFEPVGWEDTLGGTGRPQALINEDLKQCDYAVFILHDRWGSPTGNGQTSGTQEEWDLAEQLLAENKIRDIILCFKAVDPARLRDPGEQLTAVVAFKKQIESQRKNFFKSFETPAEFGNLIDRHLAKWLKDHSGQSRSPSSEPQIPIQYAPAAAEPANSEILQPGFAFWLAEAERIRREAGPDFSGLLFCATKAQGLASSDPDWAQATQLRAIALYELGRLEETTTAFGAIAERLADAPGLRMRVGLAVALFNKGVTLASIGRIAEAIAVYDDLIARVGTDPASDLREQVAKAQFNKGVLFGGLDRNAEAIAIYDELIARFRTDSAPALREQVAVALFNKGGELRLLDRRIEAVDAYDAAIARLCSDSASVARERLAGALLNKGVTLGEMGRRAQEIDTYDDLIGRFGFHTEPRLREQVATALCNKGVALGAMGFTSAEIAAYDDLIARFDADPAPVLREQVAKALLNKGAKLGMLKRSVEEIAVYDNLIARFGFDRALGLRVRVAWALFNKGIALDTLNRSAEAIAAYDDLIARFAHDPAPEIQETVSLAKTARDALRKA